MTKRKPLEQRTLTRSLLDINLAQKEQRRGHSCLGLQKTERVTEASFRLL